MTSRDPASKLAVHTLDGCIEEWLVSGVNDFDSTARNPYGKYWRKGQWMLPILWNQAGYDAVCVIQILDFFT